MKKSVIAVVFSIISVCIYAQKGPGYFMSVSAATSNPEYRYAHDVITALHDDVVMYHPVNFDTSKLFPLLVSLDTWMMQVAKSISSNDKISVIGQTHMGGSLNNAEYQNELLKSQSLVKDHIMFGKYEIVGWEGKYDNRPDSEVLTKPSSTDTMVGRALMMLPLRTDAEVDNIFEAMPLNSALWSMYYSKGLPANISIGIEDVSIWLLHGMVIHSPVFEKNLVHQRINEHLLALRSAIAFYKTIEALHHNKKDRAAIVIGSSHLKDFYYMALETPMQVNLYNTSKDEIIGFNY